ncbi:hypothetical protein [Shinella kummerowiae]|uniref:hypothetical protein n=1 Tax=Shinella kummerowiae TaxID=417745 RepID=UPI0019268F47|nr:hypothetical protein [Shinella kummerowiae]MCT7664872.1 hypothetical protein [Shinella kummerowiae]
MAELKNGELADRLADFIEMAPFQLAIWSGPPGRVQTSNAECMVTVCFLKRDLSIKKRAQRI